MSVHGEVKVSERHLLKEINDSGKQYWIIPFSTCENIFANFNTGFFLNNFFWSFNIFQSEESYPVEWQVCFFLQI